MMTFDVEEARKRERRAFRVSVLFGVAVLAIGLAVVYSIFTNIKQEDSIGDIRIETSACRVAPEGIECRIGHANSVLLTTPEEACFILAQGGYKCRDPLNTEQIARTLERSVAENVDFVLPSDDGTSAPQIEVDPPSNSVSAVPPPRTEPAPVAPSVPAQPKPTPPSAPEPAEPPSPALSAPLISNPLDPAVKVCVEAVGIKAVC